MIKTFLAKVKFVNLSFVSQGTFVALSFLHVDLFRWRAEFGGELGQIERITGPNSVENWANFFIGSVQRLSQQVHRRGRSFSLL